MQWIFRNIHWSSIFCCCEDDQHRLHQCTRPPKYHFTWYLSFRSTSEQGSWVSLLIHRSEWTSVCKIKIQTKTLSENQNLHVWKRKHIIRHSYKQQSHNSKPGLHTCRQVIYMDGVAKRKATEEQLKVTIRPRKRPHPSNWSIHQIHFLSQIYRKISGTSTRYPYQKQVQRLRCLCHQLDSDP